MCSVLQACSHRRWPVLREGQSRRLATATALTRRPSTICARVMLRLHMGHVECPLLHQDTMHSLQGTNGELLHRLCMHRLPGGQQQAPQASCSTASRHAANVQHSPLEASSYQRCSSGQTSQGPACLTCRTSAGRVCGRVSQTPHGRWCTLAGPPAPQQ